MHEISNLELVPFQVAFFIDLVIMATETKTNPFSNVTQDQLDQWNPLYEGKERVFDTPIAVAAAVVRGFGRGSKELGIPTANLCMEELADKGNALDTGIYFGWAMKSGTIFM